MNCYGSDRVIYMYYIITEPYAKYYENSCYGSNDQCSKTICYITRCCDCYQTCKGCIQTHRYIWFSITNPCEDHTYNGCCCRCDCCCHKDGCKLWTCCCCRTIESIPSKPEDETSKSTDYEVMSRKCVNFCYFSILIS